IYLICSFDQCLDIFWKAGAAVANTGIDKVITDTGVAADALTHGFNVGTEDFSQVGHLIHEADVGSEHTVGGVFGEFGTAHVHHDHFVVIAIEGGVEFAHHFFGVLAVSADNDTLGAHTVAYG